MTKVDDFDASKQVLEEMKQGGIHPGIIILGELFTKNIGTYSVREIHLWYVQELAFHPSGPIEGLIKRLYDQKKLTGAFYLILHYPHLAISKKILSGNLYEALHYLDNFSNETYYEKHINYAKEILYHLHHDYGRSTGFLQLIPQNSIPEKQLNDVNTMLKINKVKSEIM